MAAPEAVNARAALEPVRLMVFAEVAYWASAGLLSTPSREAVGDDGVLRAAADRVGRGLGARLAAQGVGYAAFQEMFFARFSAEAALEQSIRAGHLVNFVLRTGWLATGSVLPPTARGTPRGDAGALVARLGRQDFGVEARLARRLAAPGGVFVQVGANDLATVDDRPFHAIYRSDGWRKVLVEPTAAAFRALREATAGFPETTLVRAAVDAVPGARRIASSGRVAETRQATFSEALARARGLGRRESIRCVDGPGLAAEAGIDHVDVLVVDTEGHDRIVVEEILKVAEPAAIIVEWAHAGLADAVRLIDAFEARGYDWCWPPISLDFVAVKRGS